MDETEELMRLCVRALVAQMCDVPGVEIHLTPTAVLGLTGEPSPDFNRLTLADGPDGEAFLTRAVALARGRGLPLVAVMSPKAALTLGPVAAHLGLTLAGSSTLMVLRPTTPVTPSRPVRVTRALGPELVAIAGDLAAAAFDEPRDVLARCIDVMVTETAGVETWIAWDGEAPRSAVTVTPTGSTAGISLMATPPEHQRQGMGRALLTQVMADYRSRGVTRFHLGATPAGRPLYDSLGFEPIAELSAWMLSADGALAGRPRGELS
ncbi:MAG: GNAT family N-acetyltransferase [Phenylobacterium sp.]|nr:GNAT family N-acetyltransferase [Phenylobacterium sp.]MBP8247219.1 GNAT family N-acetyltransferase [Phenylobacterium sp.]